MKERLGVGCTDLEVDTGRDFETRSLLVLARLADLVLGRDLVGVGSCVFEFL